MPSSLAHLRGWMNSAAISFFPLIASTWPPNNALLQKHSTLRPPLAQNPFPYAFNNWTFPRKGLFSPLLFPHFPVATKSAINSGPQVPPSSCSFSSVSWTMGLWPCKSALLRTQCHLLLFPFSIPSRAAAQGSSLCTLSFSSPTHPWSFPHSAWLPDLSLLPRPLLWASDLPFLLPGGQFHLHIYINVSRTYPSHLPPRGASSSLFLLVFSSVLVSQAGNQYYFFFLQSGFYFWTLSATQHRFLGWEAIQGHSPQLRFGFPNDVGQSGTFWTCCLSHTRKSYHLLKGNWSPSTVIKVFYTSSDERCEVGSI